MSHIVQVATEVRDPVAIEAATDRLKLLKPIHGSFEMFTGQTKGWGVRLPRWRFPVVFDVESGQARFDNFEGHWGDPAELDRFLQCYAVEKAKIEARRAGHAVTEQPLADGSIKLTVQIGGAA